MIEQCSDKVQITIAAHIRANHGLLTENSSNPQAWIYTNQNTTWILYDKTEIIYNTIKPIFTKTFTLDYCFDKSQYLKIELYHIDPNSYSELIGLAQIELGNLLTLKSQIVMVDLMNSNKGECEKYSGRIAIGIESLRKTNEEYEFKWKGKKLMNTDKSLINLRWFDKSDPLLRLFKSQYYTNTISQCNWIKIHETEHICNDLNPKWKPFKIMAEDLTSGDVNKPLKIECWDWEKNENFQYIGEFVFTINDLMQSENKKFKLYNKTLSKHTGILKLTRFIITEKFTFLDYLLGGLTLNTFIGIAFPHSPTQPQSNKPFITIDQYNLFHQCHQSIMDICQVLLDHESNTMLPVYGFNTQCGCFPLTWLTKNLQGSGGGYLSMEEGRRGEGSLSNAITFELKRILEAYTLSIKSNEVIGARIGGDGGRACLMSIIPALSEIAKVAEVNKAKNSRMYSILVLLVDQEIADAQLALNYILQMSNLPISIIVLSLDANPSFHIMEALKNTTLKSNTSYRDFVQFIELRKAITKPPHELKSEILSKVANQVVEYMRLIGIKPVKTSHVDMTKVFMDVPNENNSVIGGINGQDHDGIRSRLLNKTGLISNNGNIFIYPSFTKNQIFVERNGGRGGGHGGDDFYLSNNQTFPINLQNQALFPQTQPLQVQLPQAPIESQAKSQPIAPPQAQSQTKIVSKPDDSSNKPGFDFELILNDSANNSIINTSGNTTNKDYDNTELKKDISSKQSTNSLIINLTTSEFIRLPNP